MNHDDMVILQKIQMVRELNNQNWMAILSIAMIADPVKTKALLGMVRDGDQTVVDLTTKLIGDDH